MKKIIAAATACLLVQTAAHGVTLHLGNGGTLMGASGIDVSGTLYNVTFSDGLLRDGITAFTDLSSAMAASAALLDQVLLGDYDTLAKNTNGCLLIPGASAAISPRECNIYTPYSLGSLRSGAVVYYAVASNGVNDGNDATADSALPLGPFDSVILEQTYGAKASTAGVSSSNIARTMAWWSAAPTTVPDVPPVDVPPADVPSVPAVPEPQTWALMLGGLGVVGTLSLKRQRRASPAAPAA